MECFLTFGVLVTAIIILVAFASKAQSRADRWNRAYQQIAQRYGGACLPAGWFSHPSVRFQYGSTHVLLNTYTSGRHGQFTQIHINWPDAAFRLEVFPDWQGGRARPLRGMESVKTGSHQFDEHYATQTNSFDETRSLLSSGVQWQIDRLRNMLGDGDIYIAIHRGRLLIKKPTLITKIDELDEFTQLALGLYDQAMLTRTVGIDFVEDNSVQVIKEATCQICGEDIVTDMVFCRRCKTPHHMECWQYYGACAVYGCQEQRFIAPRLAGPANET